MYNMHQALNKKQPISPLMGDLSGVYDTQMKVFSFWQDFHHWLHWKLSKCTKKTWINCINRCDAGLFLNPHLRTTSTSFHIQRCFLWSHWWIPVLHSKQQARPIVFSSSKALCFSVFTLYDWKIHQSRQKCHLLVQALGIILCIRCILVKILPEYGKYLDKKFSRRIILTYWIYFLNNMSCIFHHLKTLKWHR